jgi:alpha-glucosidase
VFPLRGEGDFEATCFEDDGLSQACRDGDHGQWRLRVSCTPSGLHFGLSREGRRPPVQDRMVLRLPRSDVRTLGFTGAVLEEDAAVGDWRRLTLKLVD